VMVGHIVVIGIPSLTDGRLATVYRTYKGWVRPAQLRSAVVVPNS